MIHPTARIGHGFDAHRFCDGAFVVLCGTKIPYIKGLAGHSDADCAWHALTDAILGAMALGDIGDYFPSSDETWRDEPSSTFLQHANKIIIERGYQVCNCDITIICQQPRINSYRIDMQRQTAQILGIETSCVGIKATTTDGLGFTGRGEGIASQAVVLLTESSNFVES